MPALSPCVRPRSLTRTGVGATAGEATARNMRAARVSERLVIGTPVPLTSWPAHPMPVPVENSRRLRNDFCVQTARVLRPLRLAAGERRRVGTDVRPGTGVRHQACRGDLPVRRSPAATRVSPRFSVLRGGETSGLPQRRTYHSRGRIARSAQSDDVPLRRRPSPSQGGPGGPARPVPGGPAPASVDDQQIFWRVKFCVFVLPPLSLT